MKLLSTLLLCTLCMQQPNDTVLTLEQFLFSETELPNDCHLKIVAPEARLPCNAETNPFISSNRDYIDCFAGRIIGDKTLLPNVHKTLFSIYEDQAEMGLFGMETNSNETAQLVIESMIQKIPDDASSHLFHSGNLVLWLWKDRGDNASFDELKRLIEERIQ